MFDVILKLMQQTLKFVLKVPISNYANVSKVEYEKLTKNEKSS